MADSVATNTCAFVSLTDTGTDPNNPDTDGDGCTDSQELGSNQFLGGLRDPNNFWDFYDPTRNGAIGFTDFLAVIQRNGSVGAPATAPLSAPPPPPPSPPPFGRGPAARPEHAARIMSPLGGARVHGAGG